jgi:hypothetical protein
VSDSYLSFQGREIISASYHEIAALEDSLAMTGFAKPGVPPEPVIVSEAKQSLTVTAKSLNSGINKSVTCD